MEKKVRVPGIILRWEKIFGRKPAKDATIL